MDKRKSVKLVLEIPPDLAEQIAAYQGRLLAELGSRVDPVQAIRLLLERALADQEPEGKERGGH